MNRILKSLSLGLILSVSVSAFAEKLIYTSNTPELYPQKNGYSLPKIAAFVDRMKQSRESVLFLHGGDSFAPNPLSVYDHGAHMVAILSAMSVDVMGLNRREFNYGIDQVTLLSSQAHFPMVLSNLFDKRSSHQVDGVASYSMQSLGDLQVAVIATVAETINDAYLFGTANVNEEPDFINALFAQARHQGADVTILLTEEDYLLKVPVERLKGVDAVLVAREGADEIVSKRPLVAYSGGVDDELLVLDLSKGQISAEIVHTSSETPSSTLEDVIARYTSQLNIVLDQKITTLSAPMSSFRDTLRSGESSLANLVLDAVRDYTGADFAAVGGGSIRGDRHYDAGYNLTRRDIQKELPFGGSMYVVNVTPQQLKDTLEHGVAKVGDLEGRFLQVSGLHYRYDPSLPVGNRVTTLTDEHGKELTDTLYTLAISDYMLKGGDGYQFSASQVMSESASHKRLLWNIVSDYLSDFETVAPKLEGRIKRVAASDVVE